MTTSSVCAGVLDGNFTLRLSWRFPEARSFGFLVWNAYSLSTGFNLMVVGSGCLMGDLHAPCLVFAKHCKARGKTMRISRCRAVGLLLLLLLLSLYLLGSSGGRPSSYHDLRTRHPHCMDKSTKLLATNSFRQAQQEVALSSLSGAIDRRGGPVPWAGVFYNTDWGAYLYNISEVPVSYSVVFKVNSENIHNSFAAHDYQHMLHPIDLRLEWKAHIKRYRSLSLHELQRKQVQAFGPDSKLQSFTFVREPLEHFISGIVESYFRGLGFGAHPQLMGDEHMEKFTRAVAKHQVNMNMTIDIINSFIFGQKHSYLKHILKQWKHFFPQFFSVRKWQPEFIGYLDQFDEDWSRLQSKLKMKNNIPYTAGTSHMTQGDIFGFKKSLQQLFRQDAHYMRAMCHLLIRDYICLGFELPPPCSDMYDIYGVVSNSFNE